MLKIKIPNNNTIERKYIIYVIFSEFLGLEYDLEIGSNDYEIELNYKKLTIKDTFFSKYPNDLEYLQVENIPKKIEQIDIFAASFFMLTRWEEYVNKNRDNHNRFPATESLAYNQGFLNTPIINEYLETLKSMLLQLDTNLKFKNHAFRCYVTCDVDQPFDCTTENLKNFIRASVGDILKRKSIKEFAKRIRRYIYNKFGSYKYDENYTFEWYINTCEKAGIQTTFYFIPSNIEAQNGCYELHDKKIQNLLKYIAYRGHEIGVHGSYQTYQDKEKAKFQKNIIDDILNSLEISQKVIGNRQHYLRWDSSITPAVLEYAGFDYDTTGSYADRPGFRYGVCYEFSMFDFLNRKKLNLKQKPLIVMECSIIDNSYMGLGYSEKTSKIMKDLKQKCFKYGGDFSILWHNSHFKTEEAKKMFEEIINA
jgi:peptidoglycan/xylan/chitin deacetylase (PgdA/CDA1 family)